MDMLDELKTLILNADPVPLKEYIEDHEPADFAVAYEDLDEEEQLQLLSLLDDESLASLLEYSEDDMREEISDNISDQRLLKAFSYMQKDDIVDILGDFRIGRRKQIINSMKSDDQKIITTLLNYPEDSAGGIMTTGYLALRDNIDVAAGIEKIRTIASRSEIIDTIFVLDDKKSLVGVVDLRDLITVERSALIKDIMDDQYISVSPETDQEEVARIVSKYDLTIIPVITEKKKILGVITVDDIIDVIVEEHDADLLQMAGVSREESLDTTLWESVRMRLPWLVVNLFTAFLASFTVKCFEDTISQVVALSAVMTIISGMGGNAGSQTMSIVIRELAKEDLKFSDCVKPFFKEIFLGIVDGAVNGLITAIVVSLIYGNFFLGVIVLAAMIGNLIISGIFGFLVPLILNHLHADPAVASSIFVTTATDVLGFFIFLGLAQIFLPYLL